MNVFILILNWNGCDDTIQCIESLRKIQHINFNIVIGDNGSTDNSLKRIISYFQNHDIPFYYDIIGTNSLHNIVNGDIILLDLKENHGFAIGNNLMIKYVQPYNPSYYLLLNNDTEVEPDFLEKLILFAEKEECKIICPAIKYYFDKDTIWNLGGKIIFGGFRKYHYSGKKFSKLTLPPVLYCSFITGCAMLFKSGVLMEDGSLFTNRFFFGEEDFELCLRLNGSKMVCVTNSIIYHKVGRSTKNVNQLKKQYIYYLNRFIDLKNHLPYFQNLFVRFVYNIYIISRFIKNGISIATIIKFIYYLNHNANNMENVTKEYFLKVWGYNS